MADPECRYCANMKAIEEHTAASNEWLLFENKRFRKALRIIAGEEQCLDNLMSNVDVAKEALTPRSFVEAKAERDAGWQEDR